MVIPALCRAQDVPAIKDELRGFYAELNAARERRDRSAVEKMYAPTFVWAHAAGFVDDLKATLDDLFSAPSIGAVPVPTFEPPQRLEVAAGGALAMLRAIGATPVAGRIFVTTFYEKTDGRWRILAVHQTPLLPERTWISVSPALLDAYAGHYERGEGVVTVVERRGDQLAVTHPRIPVRLLQAVSETTFFDKAGTEYEFARGADGAVTLSVKVRNGRTGSGTKRK